MRNSDCSHSAGSATGFPPMRTSTDSSSGMCTPHSLRSMDGQVLALGVLVVERVDRRAELLDRAAGEVLGRVELGAQPVVVDLRTHQLDVHPGGQRVLGDAVVQLAGDAVALVVEHLALPRRAQLGLGGEQLGVAGLEVGGLAGGAGVQAGGVVEQRRVLQRRGGLTGEDAQHGVVGVLDLPLGRRPRGEPADDAAVEPDRHVQVVAAPGARRGRRRGARRGPGRRGGARARGVVVVTARARGGAAARPAARPRPARTPPTPPRGARRRRPRPPARAPPSPPWCAPARRRSAPTPGSPAAAARRRSGTPGSSAACPSAGR